MSFEMVELSELLTPDNVLLGIAPSSKKRVFEQAAQTFSLLYGLDKKEIFDGLNARERLGSTYLDHGVALPHCRVTGLKEPHVLFMRLHGDLSETAGEKQPTHCLLFVLAPEDACEEHLRLLGQAAALFSDAKSRQNMEEAETASDFCACLKEEIKKIPTDLQ